jgi:hypothetical protein
MRYVYSATLLFLAFTIISLPASAQETQERVVDEVIAQVNEGVITLSRVKREIKSIVDAEVQQGKNREAIEKMVDEKRGELIANLINEELLMQRAKELRLEQEIDSSINQRFVQIMKEHGLKTLDALYAEMERTGVDPQEIREIWRKQATRDLVLQKEVQARVYWDTGPKELKEYYEKNRAKFTKPETVSVSEIFLGFAGRDENTVRDKAKQIIKDLQGGASFEEIAAENDPGVLTDGKGKAEKLKVGELSERLRAVLKDVKVGGLTAPYEADELGIVILRVDAREQASSESVFDESAVRLAILSEKAPAAQKDYMAGLRKDSYIKINDAYRPLVSPILFADERKGKDDKNDK